MGQDIKRLKAIREEMIELLDEALSIVRRSGDSGEVARARSYWFAQIQVALREDHDYLGGSMHSLEKCISALEDSPDDGEEDSDEDSTDDEDE